jgi:hypothetical protein
MRRLLFSSLLLLAACGDASPEMETPAAAAVQDPVPQQFTPLRPAVVDIPGNGTWVCTPAGAGQPSACRPRGTQVASAPSSDRVSSILDQVRNNTPPSAEN